MNPKNLESLRTTIDKIDFKSKPMRFFKSNKNNRMVIL